MVNPWFDGISMLMVEPYPILLSLILLLNQGPVSQRVAINRTMDINRRSMANRVLREFAINRKPFWNGAYSYFLPQT